MSPFEFKKIEILKPELISDYRLKHKLPEVNSSKTKKMGHIGCAIEYKNGAVIQVIDIKSMKVNPENPPVAISCLGSGENSPGQRAK
ncbi:MAG: hypothetical protein UR90_C0002G0021 [Parcubacteria group bacterium GW2011_GWC1_35_8]|uniref:Uncharacterized protein n=3 Tax=Candidatus Nomuraibacteriota TaxID=1752729 RepID=A0A1F6YWD8_9BACT|nr:MAG: hypothetical protein UR90_C0002G0021 [Parcubacteria group bacterium GW2011_GWC1_35_8]KKP88168.1 MAG: hypothetical protein UR91_C0025G0009 [Candidatus Nomurabacteria bacterium GW2011_GWC2_35_8]OGJ06087.1 MAG: hypothetical protein A2238_00735 [Candidatus Nomurabacteria bacterium RIFOXYA2_FULL_35_9]OGJ06863.1 MAG: hypothetical protein A2192_01130 [Candidatus Nomurabacteria bacterium RIFOXYA1_FULL_35_17]OGJ10666.1 MAG: hypothetical protein A2456_00450 [Candidatus Nomurabacteria bacterium RI